ncbi:hypothetical protein MPER_05762, partial [Moniliophthora perniciosa FA553]
PIDYPVGNILMLLSLARLDRVRSFKKVNIEVAKELVQEKAKEIGEGKGNKDVMSLLVKANLSENERARMSEAELLAQMREEIHAKKRELASRGNTTGALTVEDLESLPYLNAVIKESLRYNPVSIHIQRTATVDDVIPLSKPILASDGQYLSEIPVQKGQKAVVSVCSYNRDKNVFGEDAHEFKPDRWLNDADGIQKGASVGVYANLEIQAFIVELIDNFEFSMTPECSRIRRESAGAMVPIIEGQIEKK